jgi:hypothetical protein
MTVNQRDYPWLTADELTARRRARKQAREDRRTTRQIIGVVIGGSAGMAVVCALLWGIAG